MNLIGKAFAELAKKYSSNLAIIDGPIRISYKDLFLQKEKMKKYFLHSLRLREGDKIAFILPNCAEFISAFFAAAEIGAVTVPLNIDLRENELQHYITRCRIRAVITNSDHYLRLVKFPGRGNYVAFVPVNRLDGHIHVIGRHPERRQRSLQNTTHVSDTEALYLCTSGSTGKPKIISKTHKQVLATLKSPGSPLSVNSRDRFLSIGPFYHGHFFFGTMLLPIIKGATIVILRNFSPRETLRILEEGKITIFFGTPFIFSALTDVSDQKSDLSAVRWCFSGGARLPAHIRQSFFDTFNVVIRNAYGSSEAGFVSLQTDDSLHTEHAVGKPLKGVKIKITDDKGRRLSQGKVGEIFIRCAAMTKGYIDDSELNEEAFLNGYFRSGDIGIIDSNGELCLLARKRKVINASGTKIDPVEIQQVLMSHPKVKDAVVFGSTNTRGMEIVKAVVVAEPDSKVSEIIDFCRSRLSEFKIPRIIELKDRIPTNLLGKVILC